MHIADSRHWCPGDVVRAPDGSECILTRCTDGHYWRVYRGYDYDPDASYDMILGRGDRLTADGFAVVRRASDASYSLVRYGVLTTPDPTVTVGAVSVASDGLISYGILS